ncbi:MAG TPA: endolytic transglycosylase MltG [Candidatus Binatia bacterium]|nr:endolytic transglycosylase MltG [Candidatus Binatia bacterium]
MDFQFQNNRPKRSKTRIVFLTLFLLVVAAGAFFVYAYFKVHKSGSSDSEQITFSVPRGASTRDVGERLEEKNLISGTTLFVLYSFYEGANGKIQAGDYQLDKKMSMAEILTSLTEGKVTRTLKRVTVVEGWKNSLIRDQLEEAGLVTESQFEDAVKANHEFKFNPYARSVNYEGFLFPDTYQFDVTWDANQIIQRMLRNFESKITDQMLADMERKNLKMEDVIVLASIIEREVGRNPSVTIDANVSAMMQRERENVASIFYNRLEIDMPLQSDATVNYATGKSDRRALFSDLEIDSPYNTYKYKGLPPGPISNPGINSIRAAIYPADTDYLYFLNDPSGVAYYGRTIEEHNSNRARYLE